MSTTQPTSRDWPEDFSGENGCYLNRCCLCHETFTGHKRRYVCHVCADRDAAESKRRAEWLAAHNAPTDWTIATIDEVRNMWADYSNLLLRLYTEQKVRRELAELLDGLASDHYTRPQDWPESISRALTRSEALDAPKENTPLSSPGGSDTL